MDIINILLRVNIALLIFYIVYRIVLRKLTFYNFNRIYLLAAIVISCLLPFLKYSQVATNNIYQWQANYGIEPIITYSNVNQSSFWSFYKLATILYWSGVIVMASLFLIQFVSLLALYYKSKKSKALGFNIRSLTSPMQPFSFFKSIFVNPNDYDTNALHSILQHEAIHVKQWHSVDIILAELKRIFCWFNPAAWLILSAIRENLEFIADRAVLEKGIDSKSYQYALLEAHQAQHNNTLTNNFNFSHLKMRITMMNKTKSSDLHLLKYLLTIPIIAALMLSTETARSQDENKTFKVINTATLDWNGKQFPFHRVLDTKIEDLMREMGIEKSDTNHLKVMGNVLSASSDSMHLILDAFIKNEDVNDINFDSRLNEIEADLSLASESSNKDISTSITTWENGKEPKFEFQNLKSYSINIDYDPSSSRLRFLDQNSPYLVEKNDKNTASAILGDVNKNEVVIFVDNKYYTNPLHSIDPNSIKSIQFYSGHGIEAFPIKVEKDKKILNIITYANNEVKTKIATAQLSTLHQERSSNTSTTSFSIYPNPSETHWNVNIQTNSQNNANNTYSLIDVEGKVVRSGRLDNTTQISSQGLKNGIYFLKMIIDGKKHDAKLELNRK